jgi:hypothetical protein
MAMPPTSSKIISGFTRAVRGVVGEVLIERSSGMRMEFRRDCCRDICWAGAERNLADINAGEAMKHVRQRSGASRCVPEGPGETPRDGRENVL